MPITDLDLSSLGKVWSTLILLPIEDTTTTNYSNTSSVSSYYSISCQEHWCCRCCNCSCCFSSLLLMISNPCCCCPCCLSCLSRRRRRRCASLPSCWATKTAAFRRKWSTCATTRSICPCGVSPSPSACPWAARRSPRTWTRWAISFFEWCFHTCLNPYVAVLDHIDIKTAARHILLRNQSVITACYVWWVVLFSILIYLCFSLLRCWHCHVSAYLLYHVVSFLHTYFTFF